MQDIQAAAMNLGFDETAWLNVGPNHYPQAVDIQAMRQWLDDGHSADMGYLERGWKFRQELHEYLPWVQSALVLMVSHAHAEMDVPKDGVRVGRVARFAWSRDYHTVLQTQLEKLERVVVGMGLNAKAYVDHGPLFERSLAARAGLGWLAKQSQLVSTRLGAFTSLAVLLTNLETQQPEPNHPDRCGRCNDCVKTCPTNAILPNRQIDARKCLAYYTVEHKGAIPTDIMVGTGSWLFGCDDCLSICPWSNQAKKTKHQNLLLPEVELAHPNLQDFFNISNHEFARRFAGTAFLRAGRKSMARNAAVVLGNAQNPEHAPLLMAASFDPAWEVRHASAWAWGKFAATDPVKSQQHLRVLCQDPNAKVAEAARQAQEPNSQQP